MQPSVLRTFFGILGTQCSQALERLFRVLNGHLQGSGSSSTARYTLLMRFMQAMLAPSTLLRHNITSLRYLRASKHRRGRK